MNRSYKNLEKQKVNLRNRLKNSNCNVEKESINSAIAHISMLQFSIHKNWNKKGSCEYEQN